jgi:hypothetical protein
MNKRNLINQVLVDAAHHISTLVFMIIRLLMTESCSNAWQFTAEANFRLSGTTVVLSFPSASGCFCEESEYTMNAMGISKLIITRYTADAGSTNY